MKILRVIASVDPASGGPVAGLSAVTPALTKLGHQSEFLTLDDPAAEFVRTSIAPVHALGPTGNYGSCGQLKPWLEKHLSDYDAVIVHGLWQNLGRAVRVATQKPGRPPFFVFPHGMLDPSLRTAYPLKHVKKWLYWILAERKVIRDARAIFFTCEEERRLARTTFPLYSGHECVVSYGTSAPLGQVESRRRAWERHASYQPKPYWIFLGRLHSKKGIELLLSAYGQLHQQLDRAARPGLPNLVLAGPCADPAYLKALQEMAVKAGIKEKTIWAGMLTGEAKWGALEAAEAFILPSFQENFGIAVAEALAVGTPVLLSNRVNIWREIADDQAALVEPANHAGTLRLLQRWRALDTDTRQTMRMAAQACFRRRFEIERAAETLSQQLSILIRRPDSAG